MNDSYDENNGNNNRPIEIFDNMDPRALSIRTTLAEALCFGALKHSIFSDCMEDVNRIFISEQDMREFIQAKGLELEFRQFCQIGLYE